MAGQFTKNQRPSRPGVYFNFTVAEQASALQNTLGIVAVPIVANWGPENTVVDNSGFGTFLQNYGSEVAPGYIAVHGAFNGEGLPGRGGAARVLTYRMVGSGATAATRAFTGAGAAITLTAKYKGTRGNNFTAKVEPTAGSSTTYTLTLYGDQGVKEVFVYANTDITSLAAQINATSRFVTAGGVTSGAVLTTQSTPQAFTGGTAGTITNTEWTNALAAFESQRFSLFAPYIEPTAVGLIAAIKTWVQSMNSVGRRFMAVVGGVAGESATTALARTSTDLNDPNIVNLGVGTYRDDRFGNLSTGQLAARVAGIMAQKGETESLTFARLAGLSVVQGPTETEILSALAGGVTVLARDSHPDAPVRIEKGLTSWVTTSDADRPLAIYAVPKFVRTLHAIETQVTEFLEHNVIGRLPVNNATREYVLGEVTALLKAREDLGVIQGGWTVQVDQNPPPTASDDFISLVYGVRLGRSLEQVLNTVVVG
jgi:Phage tail sheath protein subtilisin-like domain